MANDRRYLFGGRLQSAIGRVFTIGPTPTQITAASLGTDQRVRLQVLAGTNVATAAESDWTDATASNGRPLVLTRAHPYILLTQPGTFRLNPEDLLPLTADARVWLEDATYLGTQRIVYTSDLHGPAGREGIGAGGCGGELLSVEIILFSCDDGAVVGDKPELPPGTQCVEVMLAEFASDGMDLAFVMHEPDNPPSSYDLMRARRLCSGGALFLSPAEYALFHPLQCAAPRDTPSGAPGADPAPPMAIQVWCYGP